MNPQKELLWGLWVSYKSPGLPCANVDIESRKLASFYGEAEDLPRALNAVPFLGMTHLGVSKNRGP